MPRKFVSRTTAQPAACTDRCSAPIGSSACSIARRSAVAASSSASASARTAVSSSVASKTWPVADHRIDNTDPTRTFTVTGSPGSSWWAPCCPSPLRST
ncbi:hypothetical protein G6F65_022181 [Rhizopus arrhizus]|nr:hypothetical protein G6F65_022181 [Rhizopus arrhizus]